MPSTPTRRDRQMVRILGLLAALLEGGRPSVRELASRFNTRRETIYRDLRALSDAGYPIVGDENGRLSHPRLLDRTVHAVTARIQLTEEEIAALLWAGRHQGPRGPLGKALPAACTKLRTMAAAKKDRLQLNWVRPLPAGAGQRRITAGTTPPYCDSFKRSFAAGHAG